MIIDVTGPFPLGVRAFIPLPFVLAGPAVVLLILFVIVELALIVECVLGLIGMEEVVVAVMVLRAPFTFFGVLESISQSIPSSTRYKMSPRYVHEGKKIKGTNRPTNKTNKQSDKTNNVIKPGVVGVRGLA